MVERNPQAGHETGEDGPIKAVIAGLYHGVFASRLPGNLGEKAAAYMANPATRALWVGRLSDEQRAEVVHRLEAMSRAKKPGAGDDPTTAVAAALAAGLKDQPPQAAPAPAAGGSLLRRLFGGPEGGIHYHGPSGT
jgi:hypothetical protein